MKGLHPHGELSGDGGPAAAAPPAGVRLRASTGSWLSAVLLD